MSWVIVPTRRANSTYGQRRLRSRAVRLTAFLAFASVTFTVGCANSGGGSPVDPPTDSSFEANSDAFGPPPDGATDTSASGDSADVGADTRVETGDTSTDTALPDTGPPDTAPPPDTGPPPPTKDPVLTTLGASNRFVIRGTIVTETGVLSDGEVLVKDNLIICVAPSCATSPDAAGATVIDTNGIVMPGLIDTHNHVLYNVFDESDWKPTKLYKNRNQWPSEPSYIAFKKGQYDPAETAVPCEMEKYGELKALISGTTAMIGAPGIDRKCYQSLVRLLGSKYNDLPEDNIRTDVIGVGAISATEAATFRAEFISGKTKAYVIHLAEGLDITGDSTDTSRKEFDKLEALDLLKPQMVIIHGTGLGKPEFEKMAANGMKLIWSPKSNMGLYADTTKIPVAKALGITIAIAPDWSLSGSINMLDEIRYADALDKTKFGDVLTSQDLVNMGTINAAKASGVDNYIGSIAVGKRADLMVIGGDRTKPYDALVQSSAKNVRMTMIDGKILYGDQVLEKASFSTTCEGLPVCGKPKFMCVAEATTTDKLNQTYVDIDAALATIMTRPFAPLVACP